MEHRQMSDLIEYGSEVVDLANGRAPAVHDVSGEIVSHVGDDQQSHGDSMVSDAGPYTSAPERILEPEVRQWRSGIPRFNAAVPERESTTDAGSTRMR